MGAAAALIRHQRPANPDTQTIEHVLRITQAAGGIGSTHAARLFFHAAKREERDESPVPATTRSREAWQTSGGQRSGLPATDHWPLWPQTTGHRPLTDYRVSINASSAHPVVEIR